ncbi:MAG: hypothetical protein EOP56_06660 [Sphingobacteriales bacterium]|nr:MAG: hypothetical protein EOP56_06660 [Sphingobacteriales bacterium]
MATFQERFNEQEEPLKNNDQDTDAGRKEQVDYANNAHRDGHDNEDEEDLNSMKGELANPPQQKQDKDEDAGV